VLQRISVQEWVIAGLAVVLAIVLVSLDWFSVDVTIGGITVSVTATATDGPDGWAGVLAVAFALAVVGDVLLSNVPGGPELPRIGYTREHTRVVLAGIAAGFVALKFILHIKLTLDWAGSGFFVGVALSVALVLAAIYARDGRLRMPKRPGYRPPLR
jgi:hypothetical protein